MTRLQLALVVLLIAIFVGSAVVLAQDDAADCAPALLSLWTNASNACIGGADGAVCNGGAAPGAEPAGGVSNALASLGGQVDVGEVTMLHTPKIDPLAGTAGVMWMRLASPIAVGVLVVGDVEVRDVTPPDFPAWTSFVVRTSEEPPVCSSAPTNLIVVQNNTPGVVSRIVVNGASLTLDGTVVVRTVGTETHFIALAGQNDVIVFGDDQPLLTGQQLSVPYPAGDFTRPAGAATAPIPYDPNALHNVPVALFPRPIIMPQPGFARTEGVVNLRSAPDQYAGLIREVPPGEVLSVLGANPAGDWYHVRLNTGETGWMFAEILQGSVGPIQSVYESTPLPPQRYGELGTGGRVLAPAGVNLRTGPDAGFPVVATISDGTLVTLVARSPYSPWVKVDANGAQGWLALVALETQSFIDALPIDYSVPPPPTPTLVPGTFGNAFPDPDGGG